ncbi:NlpC/P60 family protein [Shimia sp.]|uniref:NlpC/P60 family protein n=1 Tax=Shimia sp. TaxID=1954381 RepID=UPI003297C511
MFDFKTSIVDEARSWIDTPYVHQASCKGGGTDCLGLVRGIWRHLYGKEPEELPAYTRDWSEPQGQEKLWQAALLHLIPKALQDQGPGDVLLFRMKADSVAKHLGIAADVGTFPTFIHAYSGHSVVESPLSEPWQRRVVARFEFPRR